jgi:hypothetical protein
VAKRRRLPERLQRRRLFRNVQPRCPAVQRPDAPNVQQHRIVAGRFGLLESGLCRGHVLRRVRAGRQALLAKRRSDVRHEWPMGASCAVRFFGVRQRRLFGCLRPGSDAVLGQRGAAVHDERAMGQRDRVLESGVRGRRVRGRVQSGSQTVQRAHASNLRRERCLDERDGLPERVQRRRVLGHVQPRSEAVQRPAASDM